MEARFGKRTYIDVVTQELMSYDCSAATWEVVIV